MKKKKNNKKKKKKAQTGILDITTLRKKIRGILLAPRQGVLLYHGQP